MRGLPQRMRSSAWRKANRRIKAQIDLFRARLPAVIGYARRFSGALAAYTLLGLKQMVQLMSSLWQFLKGFLSGVFTVGRILSTIVAAGALTWGLVFTGVVDITFQRYRGLTIPETAVNYTWCFFSASSYCADLERKSNGSFVAEKDLFQDQEISANRNHAEQLVSALEAKILQNQRATDRALEELRVAQAELITALQEGDQQRVQNARERISAAEDEVEFNLLRADAIMSEIVQISHDSAQVVGSAPTIQQTQVLELAGSYPGELWQPKIDRLKGPSFEATLAPALAAASRSNGQSESFRPPERTVVKLHESGSPGWAESGSHHTARREYGYSTGNVVTDFLDHVDVWTAPPTPIHRNAGNQSTELYLSYADRDSNAVQPANLENIDAFVDQLLAATSAPNLIGIEDALSPLDVGSTVAPLDAIIAEQVLPALPSWQETNTVTSEDAFEFQSIANQLGYNAGRPDGIVGPRTNRALRALQEAGIVSAGSDLSTQHVRELKRAAGTWRGVGDGNVWSNSRQQSASVNGDSSGWREWDNSSWSSNLGSDFNADTGVAGWNEPSDLDAALESQQRRLRNDMLSAQAQVSSSQNFGTVLSGGAVDQYGVISGQSNVISNPTYDGYGEYQIDSFGFDSPSLDSINPTFVAPTYEALQMGSGNFGTVALPSISGFGSN